MTSRFADLKVAHKLLLGFGLVFLLIASMLIVNVLASIQQDMLLRRLVVRLYPARNTIEQVGMLIQAIDDDGAWYMLQSSPTQATEMLKSYDQKVGELRTLLDSAQQLAQSPKQQQDIKNLRNAYFGKNGYYVGNEVAFRLKRSGKMQLAYQAYVHVPFEPSLLIANGYQQEIEQAINQARAEDRVNVQLTFWLSLMFGCLAVVVGIIISKLTVISITAPLKQVQQAVREVSSHDMVTLEQGLRALAYGDLTHIVRSCSSSPDYESRDEIGQTALSVRTIIADIRKIIGSYEHARQELQLLYQKLQAQNKALLEANERLQALSVTDMLTSLGNHRAYQEALHAAIERAYSNEEVAMLALIDLDELKILNEEYGHRYGDQLLSTLADLLRELHFTNNVFRLSGDTFAILVPISAQATFISIAENLRLKAHEKLGGATISVGIATSIVGESQDEMLQEHAYAALHEAKKRGRDLVVSFEAVRNSVKLLSLQKIHALRRLLSEKKTAVAFQPIWDLEKGRAFAFEALSRPDPSYGFASPADAFEMAEQLGRGYDLDMLCIHATLQRASELPADALLFMNITPQTFNHDRFSAEDLKEHVVRAALSPERVVIEITERASIRLELLLEVVHQLRQQGFLLALDDTGAGNAGLEMLHQVSVDFVKIDRAVVVNAMTQRSSRGVLNGICAIARESNSCVIVEGIENKAMLDLAYQLDIRGAQGYLLGRPAEQIASSEVLAQYNPQTIIGKLIAS